MIPLFSSSNSFNSILTIDEKNVENGSYSIFQVAKELALTKVYLAEKNPSSFPQALSNAKKNELQLIYGLYFTVCYDLEDTELPSRDTEHKILVFAKSGTGYKRLMQLYSDSATIGFHEYPRIDVKLLKKHWNNQELFLIIPFYDSFLWQNTFFFKQCVFNELKTFDPLFSIEDHGKANDKYFQKKVVAYCDQQGYNYIKTHTCYYAHREDFKSYMVYRCIQNKSDMREPNLADFNSDQFYALT